MKTVIAYPLMLTATALLFLAGCGEKASEPEAPAAAEPAETAPAALPRTPSPEGARVFFITPADGATVTNPVEIEFGIEGMTVVRAGVEEEHSGHHHLIVDAGLPPLDVPIPADDNYIHFGDGSTATTLELAPGQHTLQLLLGDYLHIPHDPPVSSETITITVLESRE